LFFSKFEFRPLKFNLVFLWQSSHELSAAVHELVQIKKKTTKNFTTVLKTIFSSLPQTVITVILAMLLVVVVVVVVRST